VATLRDEGKCIIYSTHIMREVERLCDRLAIIHRGRILAAGSQRDLLEASDQPDLEEHFFDLVSQFENPVNEDMTTGTRPASEGGS
jgi:sodium transport system ATP-binding protein